MSVSCLQSSWLPVSSGGVPPTPTVTGATMEYAFSGGINPISLPSTTPVPLVCGNAGATTIPLLYTVATKVICVATCSVTFGGNPTSTGVQVKTNTQSGDGPTGVDAFVTLPYDNAVTPGLKNGLCVKMVSSFTVPANTTTNLTFTANLLTGSTLTGSADILDYFSLYILTIPA